MDILYKDLLRELECPVCTDYMAPPIRQCKTGHSICSKCHGKLNNCPMCQQNYTEARNTSLEALAAKMQYPCINNNIGCQARLTLVERDFHEKVCPYKKYSCPMNNCSFKGNIDEVKSHWQSKKTTSKPYGVKNVCHTKLKASSYFVNIVNAYDELFWFKSKIEQGKFFWAVQYVGDSSKASNYYYEIEVFRAGLTKRKLILGDYCQSIDISDDDIFKKDNCPSVFLESLNHFVGSDDLLIYYFRLFNENNFSEESEHSGTTGIKPRNESTSGRSKSQTKGGFQKKMGKKN